MIRTCPALAGRAAEAGTHCLRLSITCAQKQATKPFRRPLGLIATAPRSRPCIHPPRSLRSPSRRTKACCRPWTSGDRSAFFHAAGGYGSFCRRIRGHRCLSVHVQHIAPRFRQPFCRRRHRAHLTSDSAASSTCAAIRTAGRTSRRCTAGMPAARFNARRALKVVPLVNPSRAALCSLLKPSAATRRTRPRLP